MRIPDAYFDGGMGQRAATPRRFLNPDRSDTIAIGHQVQQIGEGMLRDGVAQMQKEKSEIEHLEKIKRDGEARTGLFTFGNELTAITARIAADKALTPQQKQEAFRAQAEELRGKFSETLPEEYRYAFAPAIAENHARAGAALDEHLAKDLQIEIRAAGATGREQLLNSARPLEEKLELLKDPDAWNWEGEGYDDAQRQKVVAELSEQATEAEVAERLNSDDPRKVLADLRATKGNDGGDYAQFVDLSPKTRQALIRTAKSQIEAQEREAERRKKEAKAAIDLQAREAFEQYKNLREGLLPIGAKAEAGFWKLVAGTEYEEKAREVRKRTGALGFVAEKVKTDPLKFGAAQLGVEVPELSVDDPQSWADQLTARGTLAGKIKTLHGLTYTPILTNDEAAGLTGLLKAQSPQSQTRTLTGLTSTLGADSVRQVARQFAASDPDLGMIAGLAADGRDKAAFHVADGRRLMEEKALTTPAPLARDMRDRFDKEMDQALAGMPQAREAFFRATQSAYVSLLGAAKAGDEQLDKKLFAQALQMVVGETAEVNGKRVLLPPNVDEERFLTNWRRIDEAKVQVAGGVYGFADNVAAAEAIRDDAEPWEAGPGRYRFSLDGKMLLTADGSKPFELSLADMAGQKIKIGARP